MCEVFVSKSICRVVRWNHRRPLFFFMLLLLLQWHQLLGNNATHISDISISTLPVESRERKDFMHDGYRCKSREQGEEGVP